MKKHDRDLLIIATTILYVSRKPTSLKLDVCPLIANNIIDEVDAQLRDYAHLFYNSSKTKVCKPTKSKKSATPAVSRRTI